MISLVQSASSPALVRTRNLLANLAVIFLITGCASTTVQTPQPGASTPDRSSSSQSGRELPEVRENEARPKAPTIAPPRNSGAQTLLARADTALAAEQPATAVLLLERAVRIEPREALLWIRLSQAHLDQGDSRAAFQHARKAIALAGSQTNKRTAAWLQLANVYQAQGKDGEAKQIRNRYGRSSG